MSGAKIAKIVYNEIAEFSKSRRELNAIVVGVRNILELIMKKQIKICLIIIFVSLLSACQNFSEIAETDIPELTMTSVASATETYTPIPSTTPTLTLTNTPTATEVPPTPTPSPPEIVLNSFTSVNMAIVDSFDSYSGWNNRLGDLSNGELEIKGIGNWDKIERSRKLRPSEGVILQFKYSEDSVIEILLDNGKWDTSSYRRYGIYLSSGKLFTNIWQGKDMVSRKNLTGSLQLLPGAWYNLLLAVNDEGKFATLMWNPSDPLGFVNFSEQFDESWIKTGWAFNVGVNKGTTVLDKFSVFSFDDINLSRTLNFASSATLIDWANTEINIENIAKLETYNSWGKGVSDRQMYADDGNKLIIQTLFGLYIYDVDGNDEISFIENANYFVLSPDSKSLAIAFPSGVVELWDMSTVAHQKTIRHSSDQSDASQTNEDDLINVQSMAFSFDGDLIAIGYGDKRIDVYQLENFELLYNLASPYSPLPASITFSPDGRFLLSDNQEVARGATINYINDIGIWQAEEGEFLGTIYQAGKISDFAITPDGTRLVSTKWGGFVFIYELPSGNLITNFGTGLHFPIAHYSIDGDYILINYGKQVRSAADGKSEQVDNVYDIKANPVQMYVMVPEEKKWALQHISGLQNLRFVNDVPVAWGSIDQTIYRWEVTQHSFTPYVLDTRWMRNMTISHDENFIAACVREGLLIINSESEETNHWGKCRGRIAFSQDDQLVLRNYKMVDILKFPDGELTKNIRDFYLLASTPSGHYFLTISKENKFVIWDAEVTRKIPLTDIVTDRVTSFVVSPDETLAVSADDKVRFWRLSDGWQTKILSITAGSLAFSTDGSFIAVGAQDGAIYLYQMPSGDELAKLEGHRDMVVDLMFTPDGNNLLSLSEDGTIRVWGILP